jgi:hypothetical protein
VYGLGHSEEVVARALRDIPATERPYVFTKGGMVWDESNPAAEPARIGRPDSLRREVEASLRRLGLERESLRCPAPGRRAAGPRRQPPATLLCYPPRRRPGRAAVGRRE